MPGESTRQKSFRTRSINNAVHVDLPETQSEIFNSELVNSLSDLIADIVNGLRRLPSKRHFGFIVACLLLPAVILASKWLGRDFYKYIKFQAWEVYKAGSGVIYGGWSLVCPCMSNERADKGSAAVRQGGFGTARDSVRSSSFGQ
jgi:hypothetical protein